MTPEQRKPSRADRSRDETWIRSFLASGEVVAVAMVVDGRPSVVPRLYAFDGERNALYFHGAPVGETFAALETGAPVAATVFRMGRLLPADEALEFGLEYASVVVHGEGRVVEDAGEAEHGLRLIMEKYAPHLKAGTDYRAMTPEEVERTAVFRLDIQSWSGKERPPVTDVPGAYRLEEVR